MTAGGAAGGAPAALGEACVTGTGCQSGFCVDNVCCNTACTDGCQACSMARTGQLSGTCAPVPNGGVCRAAAGACDVAEVCTNGSCGADAFLDGGTSCRPSVGSCDVAETCTGASPACPPEVLVASGTVCRASTGVCDREETCTGALGTCPADERHPAGFICRAAGGGCDVAEVCDGVATLCPADALLDAGVVCRAAAGTCDVAETCAGTSAMCPTDTFVPSTSLACAPYRCTGSSAACTTSCANSTADCATQPRTFCNVSRCEAGRLVFVTSTQHASNFGVGAPDGGVLKGDSICQDLANDAGLGGSFRAWLSDPTSSPATRFTRDGGSWIRNGDRALIARDWADLTDGTIGATISTTERRVTPTFSTTHALTGTTTNGTSATFSGGQTNTHCSGWTSTSNTFSGTRAEGGNFTMSNWTNASNNPCGTLMNARLFCFEQ